MITTDSTTASPFHGVTAPSGAQPAVDLPDSRRRGFWRASVTTTDDVPDADPILLTVAEAAKALRVSRWMIYNLVRSNKLATISIGRRRLVPRAALAALIKELGNEGGI